jgi:hypothetical protein
MSTALIRHGPWGVIQEYDPEADQVATLRIASLRELAKKIAELNAVVH